MISGCFSAQLCSCLSPLPHSYLFPMQKGMHPPPISPFPFGNIPDSLSKSALVLTNHGVCANSYDPVHIYASHPSPTFAQLGSRFWYLSHYSFRRHYLPMDDPYPKDNCPFGNPDNSPHPNAWRMLHPGLTCRQL